MNSLTLSTSHLSSNPEKQSGIFQRVNSPWFSSWGFCIISSSLTSVNSFHSFNNSCYFFKYCFSTTHTYCTALSMVSRNPEEVTAARALAPGIGHFARQSVQGNCSNAVQQVLLLCKHAQQSGHKLGGVSSIRKNVSGPFRLLPNSPEMSGDRPSEPQHVL